MPPIFVDGVEITEVFVDGVEQDSVFCDGVEVYTGEPVGDVMIDDYNRSPNGTLLTNHLMNTGQGWQYGLYDTGSVIAPAQGEQTASTGTTTNLVSRTVDIVPQPVVRAPAFHAQYTWGRLFTNPMLAYDFIYAQGVEGQEPTQAVAGVAYTVFADLYLYIQMGGFDTQLGFTGPFPNQDSSGLFECWYDGINIQCAMTLNAGRFLSGLVPVTLALPRNDTIRHDDLNIANDARADIKDYNLTPYDVGSVPFP